MPYVPLKIPPGVFRNGTKYQAKGRWYVANLVRWTEGAMQAIGGWTQVQDSSDTALDLTDAIRGVMGWRINTGAPHMALGTYNKAYAFAGGVLTDITPAGFTAGLEDATASVGLYDKGAYDAGLYSKGAGGGGGGTITEAQNWHFDSFGQLPIALAYSDGKIYDWDLNVVNNLVVVHAGAPTGCKGMVVTPERFIVGLGGTDYNAVSAADGRRVTWCDQENSGDWNPAMVGGQAGDFILPGNGALMCGARNRNETLLWTDMDLFAMRYIGGVLVYSFVQVGVNCGIISRRAHAEADGRAFWMGTRGFYMYDGFAKPLPCEIQDEIFPNLTEAQASKVAAWTVSESNEVWFAYPSGGSVENNKIVTYNYMENHWSGPWDLERTAGMDRGVYDSPVMCDGGGDVYFHEYGDNMLDTDANSNVALVPYAESGPFELAAGDNLMTVNRYIPDETTYGDCALVLYAGMYPTDAVEDEQTGITIGEITDTRLTGRQIRLKITETVKGWRFGIPRLEVIKRGRR